MTPGSSMLAMILSLPPQRAQASISMPNSGPTTPPADGPARGAQADWAAAALEVDVRGMARREGNGDELQLRLLRRAPGFEIVAAPSGRHDVVPVVLAAAAQAGVRHRDRGLRALRRQAQDHRQHRGSARHRDDPLASGEDGRGAGTARTARTGFRLREHHCPAGHPGSIGAASSRDRVNGRRPDRRPWAPSREAAWVGRAF